MPHNLYRLIVRATVDEESAGMEELRHDIYHDKKEGFKDFYGTATVWVRDIQTAGFAYCRAHLSLEEMRPGKHGGYTSGPILGEVFLTTVKAAMDEPRVDNGYDREDYDG